MPLDNSQKTQSQSILAFWRAIESLTPQKLERSYQKSSDAPVYNIDGLGVVLPWNDQDHCHKKLPANKMWRYTLRSGVYEIDTLVTLLKNKIGVHADVYDERTSNGQSRLFDLGFDDAGYPLPETFVLSLACWSVGQILHFEDGMTALEEGGRIKVDDLPAPDKDTPPVNSGYAGFDELSRRIMTWLAQDEAKMRENASPPQRPWLNHLTHRLAEKIHFPRDLVGENIVSIASCRQIKKMPAATKQDEIRLPAMAAEAPPNRNDGDSAQTAAVTPDDGGTQAASDPTPVIGEKDPETPMIKRLHDNQSDAPQIDLLNSFCIGDLNTIRAAWDHKNIGEGLARYLTATAQHETNTYLDVRTQSGISAGYQALAPDRMPHGRWPSDHPLVFSQQWVVNEAWQRLGTKSGLLAVNGPPGTGKTTLLRDIVATVIVERAVALRHIPPNTSAFGNKKSTKLGDKRISYYELQGAIAGTAIVVASANNSAVENVSLELPGENAVPERARACSDYFTALANQAFGKPSWGLLAAKLGNKKNRDDFLSAFWWKTPKDPTDNKPEIAAASQPFQGEGLRYHLRQILDGKRSPFLSWEAAVARLDAALQNEQAVRQRLAAAAQLPADLQRAHNEHAQKAQVIAYIEEQIKAQRGLCDNGEQTIARLAKESTSARERLDVARVDQHTHFARRPGFLIWLSTWGRAHREWWDRGHTLAAIEQSRAHEHATAVARLAESEEQQRVIQRQLTSLAFRLEAAQESLAQADNKRKNGEARVATAKDWLGAHWPDPDWDEQTREKASPWASPEWQQAREDVFLAALMLHRAFIEHYPAEITSNLYLVCDWLAGKRLPADMAHIALDTLCLVVPIISTTFASIPRMFADIGREGIGWLLIDEAGQALPQQAAGAIWRARRAVVVGDPNQLEPVLGLPPNVEGALGHYYGVAPCWWPSETSTQRLADMAMDIGTRLPGKDGDSIWVGFPLRVHRRCDEPMFTVSNRIAYDGLMVNGKTQVDSVLPTSGWFDVRGDTQNGHWVPAEGKVARVLLEMLIRDCRMGPENLFLITPFRDCARQLKAIAREMKLDEQKAGTIHTAQGREADIVILVLGGGDQSGAKNWVAEKPNMLNVAVSRAKKRLYVIGDHTDWSQRRYFDEAARQLRLAGPRVVVA